MFDDDGGGRHPGLHRAIRHTLQAMAEIGRAMACHGDSGVPGLVEGRICRSGFGFGRINLASSLSFQRTVVSNINPPTPRTDLKHP